MTAWWALVARELRSLFVSPVGWAVIAGYVLLNGYFFFNLVSRFGLLVQRFEVQAQIYRNPQMLATLNLNDLVVSSLFMNQLLLLVFIVPVLTMRTFAEERRQGTDELLLTAPVGPGTLVAGKFVGVVVVCAVLLVAGCGFLGILLHFGDPETGPMWTGLVGLSLVSTALAALGIAVSAATDSQVVAGVGAFALFLLLFIVAWPAEAVGGTGEALLRGLSLPVRFESFRDGVVDSADVVYYLSLTALGLFTARALLASRRWR
jgi:ABC-2 type transport system permease protein